MLMNVLTKTVASYDEWYNDYLSCPYKDEMSFDDFWNGTLIPVIWDGFEWIEKP